VKQAIRICEERTLYQLNIWINECDPPIGARAKDCVDGRLGRGRKVGLGSTVAPPPSLAAALEESYGVYLCKLVTSTF
jgi:hypothetical protein